MNSNDISKLLRTKPHQYIIKDYDSKTTTSSCWSTFGLPAEVVNEQNKEFKIIEGFASCKKCFTTFTFRSGSKGTGTKNLSDHKCSKKDVNQPTLHEVVEEKIVPNHQRDELIDSLANWCATSIRPFQCVEDPGFISVSQLLLDIGSRYGRSLIGKVKAETLLPCANTVKRRIQSLAEITRTEVSARLVAAGGRGELVFSPDLWTDRYKKQTYLGMTAIFMEDGVIHSVDLCCREFLYSKKSAENISKSIDAVLNEFNVQQYRKSAPFVIDRGANLKAALLPNQIIHCTTHRIHNILRDTFGVSQSTTTDTTQSSRKRKRKEESDTAESSDDSNDEFDESTSGSLGDIARTINKCKKMVRYVRKTGLNRKIQEKGGFCLIQENQTRWLSLHGMLNSIERSYNVLVHILSDVDKLDLLTTIDRRALKDIIWFLEPFRRVITDLQAQHRSTLPMVVPCIWYLKDELKSKPIDSSILRTLKDRCLTYLEHKIELKDIHFAAAMLNPNYRTLRQATKAEQSQAQKLIRRRMEMITKSTASPEQSTNSSGSDDDGCNYLSKYVDNPPVSRKQDELTRYLKFDHREMNSSDVLEFWSSMADSLPILTKVAFQILAIPASSASVERSFSAAGQVVSERRSNISPDLVNDILFLRSTKK